MRIRSQAARDPLYRGLSRAPKQIFPITEHNNHRETVSETDAPSSLEIPLKWLPVIEVPSLREMVRLAVREPGVIEHDCRLGSLVREIKLRNRVNAGIPIYDSPGESLRVMHLSAVLEGTLAALARYVERE